MRRLGVGFYTRYLPRSWRLALWSEQDYFSEQFPISIEEHSRKHLSSIVDINSIKKIPELIKKNTFDKEDEVVKSYLDKYFY